MPTPRARPPRDMMFSETPRDDIGANVINSEMGIETATKNCADQVPQKQIEHQHCKQTADHRSVAHLVDALLDEDRTIGNDLQTHPLVAIEPRCQ